METEGNYRQYLIHTKLYIYIYNTMRHKIQSQNDTENDLSNSRTRIVVIPLNSYVDSPRANYYPKFCVIILNFVFLIPLFFTK